MNELTIGEVARRAGVAPSTVRYYEQRGPLPVPQRRNGRRRYDAAIVQHLALIKLAQQAGFTLGEITTLVYGFIADTSFSTRWQALARQKLVELEAQRMRIQQMEHVLTVGLQCACVHLTECALYQACAG